MAEPNRAPAPDIAATARPRGRPAPFLPMTRVEMDALGWDACDVILVTGDAYIDHPSFGMALVGRLLESQGFRVGIISQPDWHSAEPFRALGRPRLYFGITAGNMDSMVNRYTSDRKIRSDDAYTPDAAPNRRPDRAVTVYAQRAREAFPGVAVVIGSIEASLRRIAHYDYWSDRVRRSVLPDSKADLLIFGNAERALVALTHRLAAGEPIASIRDLRGTAFMVKPGWRPGPEWAELDSTHLDTPGRVDAQPDPYAASSLSPGPSPGGGEEPGSSSLPQGERSGERERGAGGEGKASALRKPLPEDLLAHARTLHRTQTDAEQLLWGILRAKRFLGLKFRRQHPVGRYILDFYCDELKLAVELDGSQHRVQQAYDTERTGFLQAQGIQVLRYWNNEVLQQTEAVLEALHQAVCTLKPGLKASSPPASPPEGEGSMLLQASAPQFRRVVSSLPPSPPGGGTGGEAQACALAGLTSSASKTLPAQPLHFVSREVRRAARAHTVVRLPGFEAVKDDPPRYAHASRVFHLESNPGNARALVQAHGEREVWLNPPPLPLTMAEMDYIYGLPYARRPHPAYGRARIPAWDMIKFSVNIMRGCFGGCTFCSITEHEGRIIQSRSEGSVLREIEEIRDKTPGFAGHITDLGGPTANMYRLACKDPKIESACRRLSCVYPGICENLGTDHGPLIALYRKARKIPGVKRISIGSGLRYDLAVRSPEYVRELVTHHVSGLLKIAPEHIAEGPLAKMMKPGIGAYERFKTLFERYSREAGKKQHLVPYFIAAHPGTTDEDMLQLALWLKANGFRLDQVQTFLPTPMALATAMYHSRRNPLRRIGPGGEVVETPRAGRQRRLHKAFLRYHDPENWPLLREALVKMGRSDLIGNRAECLVPRGERTGAPPRHAPRRPQ